MAFSRKRITQFLFANLLLGFSANCAVAQTPDPIASLQQAAAESNKAEWGHWGPNPEKYSSWMTHSNRLIPIYVFGGNLDQVCDEHSVYRNEKSLEKLYGYLPESSVNPKANYCDQTDIYRIQKLAVEQGKRRIVLMVFDGMDWQITQAAAIAKTGAVQYQTGRGKGLLFQDYRGAETDFGSMVTSPHNEGTTINVNDQKVKTPGGKHKGGYNAELCGPTPWGPITDPDYPIGTSKTIKHTYTDSASSATSMTCGIKTYNDAICVDSVGREVIPIARTLQEQGFAVGTITSVPISHATPACSYANNVHRDDYQDLTRDMLGRPSVFHPGGLPGLDVLIGAGWGESHEKDGPQGENFVAGNRYITAENLSAIDVEKGGKYVVVQRTSGAAGKSALQAGVEKSLANKQRLFGYFGVEKGHLPFETADGKYDPVKSFANQSNLKAAEAEKYSPEDLRENVTLADMTKAALDVLHSRSDRWWLMIEAGDVDWANHQNNIDNSIGAVLSGEAAFKVLVEWIEQHGGWKDTLVVVTSDHGHYFQLDKPEALTANKR